MKIAYLLYPGFTALDPVGPYEVISRWPDAEVHFVARSFDPVRCDRGLTVIPTDTPTTLPNPCSSAPPSVPGGHRAARAALAHMGRVER
jgi:cyclohexyl-isocyanide hydratase